MFKYRPVRKNKNKCIECVFPVEGNIGAAQNCPIFGGPLLQQLRNPFILYGNLQHAFGKAGGGREKFRQQDKPGTCQRGLSDIFFGLNEVCFDVCIIGVQLYRCNFHVIPPGNGGLFL